MNSTQINIIIADDSSTFIEVIKDVLSSDSRFNIIEIYSNGKDLAESDLIHKANVILSDIEMPLMNGIEAAKKINYIYPEKPIIALTMHIKKVYLQDIVMAGFKGFVHKPEIPAKLSDVIEQVLDNKFVFPETLQMK